MTTTRRAVQTTVEVCDLCNEIIKKEDAQGTGSIISGWLAHPVELPRTKRAWLLWPPPGTDRKRTWQEREKPEWKKRQYDFHGRCILDLVEANLFTPTPPTVTSNREAKK